MDTLEIVEQVQTLTLSQRISKLDEVKKDIISSGHIDTFKDTRLGIYLLQLKSQVEKMVLSPDEQRFMDLAKNLRSDIFHSTSGITSQVYSTPSVARTTSAAVHNGLSNKCMICMDENTHREVLYAPCGHFMTCSSCSVEWNKTSDKCPYCNGQVTGCIFVDLVGEQKLDGWTSRCPDCKLRRVELVSEDCKHAFSCKKCVSKQKTDNGCVKCSVCSGEVNKVAKIFL
jgi:hypothetical protein